MSRRAELHALVRDLKDYLRWQRAFGAAGSVPASNEERRRFEAKRKARDQKRLERLADQLDVESSPRETPAPTPPVEDASGARAAVASETRPDAPPSGATDDGEASPWKEFGSRPTRRLQDDTPAEMSTPDDNRGGPTSAGGDDDEMSNRQKLEFLRQYLGDCRRCGLCEHRTNIAFGVGDPEARLVFVGEAPGRNEDLQGEPFVGKAGQLLDKMIGAMGLERDDVYICNVIKCRPPDNRNPHPDEIRECAPFLQKQLEAIEPTVIVTLGKFASQFLTGQEEALGALRGRWHTWKEIPVMPTYHPAYLLRSPNQKGKVWSDLQMVMERLGLT